ncbi:MAG: MFS transporter, partial [Chitinophagaceae bacterium]|nr:MFS transporter [Chitinophagaceae bacterium]
MSKRVESTPFTRYETFLVAILAILQFTIVLDFMVLSPMGAILLKELDIKPVQFGLVVSAYAFSAGASGLLAAGFADKFDRKKLLLFFYTGFVAGTIMCAMAPNYKLLLIARIITGLFGGVISSISFAIITDVFRMEVRGRVMGFVQMAFAVSQVLGIPVGLLLANKYDWHAPFWLIAVFAAIVGIIILIYMKPVTGHLRAQLKLNPLEHLWKTLSKGEYLRGFLVTTLLATGGFMLMPFSSAFTVNNQGISIDYLPLIYIVTGVFSIVTGPVIGKLSDIVCKNKVFFSGTHHSIIMVGIFTNIGINT